MTTTTAVGARAHKTSHGTWRGRDPSLDRRVAVTHTLATYDLHVRVIDLRARRRGQAYRLRRQVLVQRLAGRDYVRTRSRTTRKRSRVDCRSHAPSAPPRPVMTAGRQPLTLRPTQSAPMLEMLNQCRCHQAAQGHTRGAPAHPPASQPALR